MKDFSNEFWNAIECPEPTNPWQPKSNNTFVLIFKGLINAGEIRASCNGRFCWKQTPTVSQENFGNVAEIAPFDNKGHMILDPRSRSWPSEWPFSVIKSFSSSNNVELVSEEACSPVQVWCPECNVSTGNVVITDKVLMSLGVIFHLPYKRVRW